MAKAKFKPLSFSTTMRNPNRISGFMSCILPFEGQILTNGLILEILKDVMRKKLYKPTLVAGVADLKAAYEDDEGTFSDTQLNYLIQNSVQNHKEAGFDKGWPSRFDTMYKLPMEFGFLQYSMGAPIRISKLGHMIVEAFNQDPVNELMIQNIFLNALMKYPVNNPYRKILNDNVPLVLLLQVLKGLKALYPSGAGLSRQELSFLICWPDHNASAVISYIKAFRDKYSFGHYTDEIIYERCLKLLGATMAQSKYFKMDKITGEAVDEYIRKMRSTGIISLRGNGRFIDLNSLETEKIDYILANYATPKRFTNLDEYMDYMGSIDEKIVSLPRIEDKELDDTIKIKALRKYAKSYTKDDIFTELVNVCKKKPSSDPMLKFIEAPTRFEFLTSLALVQNFESIGVYPNYVVDDEGLPIRHASGGKADIVCLDNVYEGLVEVTLMLGRQQTNNEILPIARHLQDELQERDNVVSLFIAPVVFDDAVRMAEWLKFKEQLNIKTFGIDEFLDVLTNYNNLDEMVAGEFKVA